MRRIFSGIFWADLDTQIWKAAICYLALTLSWALISIGLYGFEGNRSYFEIKAVLLFKIIFAAVIFLGRQLLFTKYRRQKWLGWLFAIFFMVTLGTQGESVLKAQLNWIYILLKIGDALVWGIFMAVFIESLGALFGFWRQTKKISVSFWGEFWQVAGQDIFSLGIWLTLLAGLGYYYVTSFYLIDTLFYSYLLLAPVLVMGLGLYIIIRTKVNSWFHEDINLLDQEIDTYLQWQSFEEPQFTQKLPRLEYLTLIRSYLIYKSNLKIPWKVWGGYLLFTVFILALPYIFGLVIEVGSFK
jgi:hypothetical protein